MRSWYLISVSGYGDFVYYGTEAEAESMRRHKAMWEGAVAKKRPVSHDHPMVIYERASLVHRWRSGTKLDERELDAACITAS